MSLHSLQVLLEQIRPVCSEEDVEEGLVADDIWKRDPTLARGGMLLNLVEELGRLVHVSRSYSVGRNHGRPVHAGNGYRRVSHQPGEDIRH